MAVKQIVVSNMGRTHVIEQNIPAQVENPQYVWVNLDEASKYDEKDIFRQSICWITTAEKDVSRVMCSRCNPS